MLVSFEPHMWYKFTNSHCGHDNPLDIVNDNGHNSSGLLKMAAWGPKGHSGQHWQLRPHEDHDGTYKLCTWFLGASKCLDIHRVEKSKPRLAGEGNYSSQKWRIVPWFKNGSWDGTYKLWNTYSGEDVLLDTKEDSRIPILRDGSYSGMHWTIEPIQPILSEVHLMG